MNRFTFCEPVLLLSMALRETFAWPLLEQQRLSGELTLPGFSLVPGHHIIFNKISGMHSCRRGCRFLVSAIPFASVWFSVSASALRILRRPRNRSPHCVELTRLAQRRLWVLLVEVLYIKGNDTSTPILDARYTGCILTTYQCASLVFLRLISYAHVRA
jgi:hypothetical protein